ncbi:hypothetical protein WN943_012160 [Citrus x changshan-huyou]
MRNPDRFFRTRILPGPNPHHLSHLSLYHGQQKGVDFAAVFCGLWGWILGLCSVACGGGFRGCVSRPVVVDFAACGGGFRSCGGGQWGWISRLFNLRKAIRVQNPESGKPDFSGLNPDRTRIEKNRV